MGTNTIAIVVAPDAAPLTAIHRVHAELPLSIDTYELALEDRRRAWALMVGEDHRVEPRTGFEELLLENARTTRAQPRDVVADCDAVDLPPVDGRPSWALAVLLSEQLGVRVLYAATSSGERARSRSSTDGYAQFMDALPARFFAVAPHRGLGEDIFLAYVGAGELLPRGKLGLDAQPDPFA